jgi:hypothetical protein
LDLRAKHPFLNWSLSVENKNTEVLEISHDMVFQKTHSASCFCYLSSP